MPSLCHVYLDRKPDGTPFYVGIGNARRVKHIDRNHWHAAVREKYSGWTRTVIESADREKCKEFEMFLIAEIGRRDLGKGPLVNLTDGGEGAEGLIQSPEACEKIRVSKLGFSWGRHSPDTRRRQSLASKGKPKSAAHCEALSKALKGRKLSDEHKKNIGRAGVGRKFSPETIELLRQKSTNISDETRLKRSLAAKAQHARAKAAKEVK
jgi:hypothetical protein